MEGLQEPSETAYLLDACVVLDYRKTHNLKVLSLFAESVGALMVSDQTPEREARQLTRSDCHDHGIRIPEGTWEQLQEAMGRCGSCGISRTDAYNLILARDHCLTLVTNDRPL